MEAGWVQAGKMFLKISKSQGQPELKLVKKINKKTSALLKHFFVCKTEVGGGGAEELTVIS